jgi:hypothetical protein
MKRNPRPRKYASAAERQAAYKARAEMLEFRAEPKTAVTLTNIAQELDVSRSELLLSMVKFALTNHDWARFGLTHKTLPYYQGNPIMATKKASPAQLAARKKFAEMARSGAFKKAKRTTSRNKNPINKFIVFTELSPGKYKQMLVTENKQRAISVANVNQMENKHSVVEDEVGHLIYDAATKKGYLQSNPSKRKKTVSQKISQLVHEGYPQKQAIAVALSEQRAGKVKMNPMKEMQEFTVVRWDRSKNTTSGNPVYSFVLRDESGQLNYGKTKPNAGWVYGISSIYEGDKINAALEETKSGRVYMVDYGKRKSNPVKRSSRSAVVPNPRAKKPQKFYKVSIMQEGLHKNWMGLANFYTFAEAENYANYLSKQHKNWTIKVHDTRAM